MNNTLSLSRPAILLALKISGSILALLIIILGIFYILALAEGEKDIQRNLMQR